MTPISPSNVSLKAFDSRLSRIFSYQFAIDVDAVLQRRAIHLQRQPGALARRAEVAGQIHGQRWR